MNSDMSDQLFLEYLRKKLRLKYVYTKKNKMEYYCRGWRSGTGDALAVVIPTTLVEFWDLLEACVKFDKVIIVQAANTGLTEGSSPHKKGYDRNVVVINTLKLNKIIFLYKHDQALAFAGSTLHSLESRLKPINRAPHSVIGSSCLGASITGGIANNSGGALVKRGPAYTEYSLYAKINGDGQLELVNEIGINNLGSTPREILTNLENENFTFSDLITDERAASDKEYIKRVRDTESPEPARYNSDPRRLNGASGCAGKIAVFAVRVDTFLEIEDSDVFYLGTNDPSEFSNLRREILSNFYELPDLAEYIHRDCFEIAEEYGKDTLLLLRMLGTKHMPTIFSLKRRIEHSVSKLKIFPSFFLDKSLQAISYLFPNILPKRLLDYRDKFEHHLIIKASGKALEELHEYLKKNSGKTRINYFKCTDKEASLALLHRFSAAGAALRYSLINSHEVEDVLPIDIALPRNEENWEDQLTDEIKAGLFGALYYGHFLCHVFHRDYLVRKGVDCQKLKKSILEIAERQGAKYPAEHNVGHLYSAEQHLVDFYKKLDPTNTFNPGIGKTSRYKNYS